MSEKRFTFADGFKIVAIKDNGQIMNSQQVCELLNTLSEENGELKDSNHRLAQNLIKSLDAIIKLEKENEQLKSFKSRVFNLLQDEIRKESELLNYYLKEKAPCNVYRQQVIIGVLKRLQKELEE